MIKHGTVVGNTYWDGYHWVVFNSDIKLDDEKDTVITSGGGVLNFVDEETPYGIVNGLNSIFTARFSVQAGTLQVFLNGLRLKNTEDFTYTGKVITMIQIPEQYDNLLINYRY